MPYQTTQHQVRPYLEKWDGSVLGLLGIGSGVSGMVFGLDQDRVVKVGSSTDPRNIEDIETERKAYRKLGIRPSPHVLHCFETENPYGLTLERCRMTLRKRIRMGDLTKTDVVTYAKSAAKGLDFIHHCGIIQGDVGCHNMLLDSKGVLKLADFAGSSVDGSAASVDYEKGSRLPGELEATQKTDIFALGSAFFEMETRAPPYKDKSFSEVEKLYKQGRFPSLKNAPLLGPTIRKCWQQNYENALEIIKDLERLPPQYQRTTTAETIPTIQGQMEANQSPPSKQPVSQTYVHTMKDTRRSCGHDVGHDRSAGKHRSKAARSKKKQRQTITEWIYHILPRNNTEGCRTH